MEPSKGKFITTHLGATVKYVHHSIDLTIANQIFGRKDIKQLRKWLKGVERRLKA